MATTKAPATRIMDTDPKTGKRYVKTSQVEGATVTAVKFVGVLSPEGKYSWSSATYDVTSPPPASELFAASIKWDGKTFKVGAKPAPSLGKAVRAVLGIEPLADPKPKADKAPPATTGTPPAPGGSKRKSAAQRKADKAAADKAAAEANSGSSVIETDPDTGLPRIKPEVQAKADQIVAEQVAKNAETEAAVERITSGESTVEGEVIDILTKKGTK